MEVFYVGDWICTRPYDSYDSIEKKTSWQVKEVDYDQQKLRLAVEWHPFSTFILTERSILNQMYSEIKDHV